MAPGSSTSTVNELLRDVARTADDRELVRINPVRFAELHGFEPDAVVPLPPRTKTRPPGDGVAGRMSGLRRDRRASDIAYFRERTRLLPNLQHRRDTDLSDFVEIGFTVSPEIRLSRYHDPWSLTPEEHFLSYRFAQSAFVEDGSPLRDHLRRCGIAQVYVDPGVTYRFALTAQPGYLGSRAGRR